MAFAVRSGIVLDLVAALEAGPGEVHSHSKIIRRPWWQRVWYQWIRRFPWPYWEQVSRSKGCSGRLTQPSKIKVSTEFDPERMAWQIIAQQTWLCENPSVIGANPKVLRYAARLVSELELRTYQGGIPQESAQETRS